MSRAGSGYEYTRGLLEGTHSAPVVYAFSKLVATWLTVWSGVAGGLFAPSLAIGAGLGNDVALMAGNVDHAALIALGMVGFLAAVTQAPLTPFIIVMEMIDGHAMVLSLMACALIASRISRLLGPPLYSALAQAQLVRLPPRCIPCRCLMDGDGGWTRTAPRSQIDEEYCVSPEIASGLIG